MDGKKYYWLKLKNDFFGTKEIKKLRKIAGGDTFTIIYLKMQLLSIKNDGLIKYDGTEENLEEQLSLEIDEEPEDIKLTLMFLEANNLFENMNENEYLLNKVPDLIGSETGAAKRMRALRERNNVTPMLQNVTHNKSKEIEIDIDKEIYKKNKQKKLTEFDEIIETQPEELQPIFIEFLKMRKTIKKPMTSYALELLIKKLKGFSSELSIQKKILNNSIENCWQGIFQLKDNYANSNKPEQPKRNFSK